MKGQVNFGAKEIKTKIQRMEGEIDYEVEQFAADFHPDEGMTSFQSEAPSPVDKTRKGKKKQPAVRVVPSRYMDSTRRISTRESSVGLSNPSSSSLNTSSASMRRVSHMPRHLLKTPGGPSSTTGTSDEVTTRGRDSLMVKSTRQHRTGRDLILASATQANAASVTSDTNPRLSLATPYLSRNNSGHATSSSSGMATTRAKGEREEAKAKKHKEKSGKKVDPEQKARREKDKEKLQKDKENVREKEKERLKEKLKEKAREKLREKARDAETEGKERENGKKEKKERKEKKDRAAEAERSLASWNQELALLGSALVQWSYSNARAQTLFARQQEAAERKLLAAAEEVRREQEEVLLLEHQLKSAQQVYELEQQVNAEYEKLTSLESAMEEAARGHAAIAAAVEQAGLRIPLTQASADSSALLQQLRSATAVLKDMQRLASSHFPMAEQLGSDWEELGRLASSEAEELRRCQEMMQELSELESYERSLTCHLIRLNSPAPTWSALLAGGTRNY